MTQHTGGCLVHGNNLGGMTNTDTPTINGGEGFVGADSVLIADDQHMNVVMPLLDEGDSGQRDVQTDIAAHCINGNDGRLLRAHGAGGFYSSISICLLLARTITWRPR